MASNNLTVIVLCLRELQARVRSELAPLLRHDVEHLISQPLESSSTQRIISQQYQLEYYTKVFIRSILEQCLDHRLIYKQSRLRPRDLIAEFIDPKYLPAYLYRAHAPNHSAAVQELARLYGLTEVTDDPTADIVETLFDRYFLEADMKISQFIGEDHWRLYDTQYRRSQFIITKTPEDFRIKEYMRLHGHIYEPR